MLKFAFVSAAAEREYKDMPAEVQDEFGKDLRRIQFNETTKLPVEQLQGFSVSVCELKINGSPAYRCVYVTKYEDALIVLHSFIKTTNGVDRPAMQVVDQRLKTLQAELKKQKQAELKKQKR